MDTVSKIERIQLMKKRNIENIKESVVLFMVITSALFGMERLEEVNRRSGISKKQILTLISKKDKAHFDHSFLFDTDGNTNTIEVTASPASNFKEYYQLTKDFKIGTKNTFQKWDNMMNNFYVWERKLR